MTDSLNDGPVFTPTTLSISRKRHPSLCPASRCPRGFITATSIWTPYPLQGLAQRQRMRRLPRLLKAVRSLPCHPGRRAQKESPASTGFVLAGVLERGVEGALWPQAVPNRCCPKQARLESQAAGAPMRHPMSGLVTLRWRSSAKQISGLSGCDPQGRRRPPERRTLCFAQSTNSPARARTR